MAKEAWRRSAAQQLRQGVEVRFPGMRVMLIELKPLEDGRRNLLDGEE